MKTIKIYIDEAGRWPWAWPVVVSGVVIKDPKLDLSIYDDSKILKPLVRERLYKKIVWLSSSHCLYYHNTYTSACTIDKYGIVHALYRCIDRIAHYFSSLFGKKFKYKLIIDGNRTFWLEKKRDVETIIHGDAICKPIGMASIIAKVTRDAAMIRYDKRYPHHGFAKHKWYGTKHHADMILKYGITPIHRISYLKNILQK